MLIQAEAETCTPHGKRILVLSECPQPELVGAVAHVVTATDGSTLVVGRCDLEGATEDHFGGPILR